MNKRLTEHNETALAAAKLAIATFLLPAVFIVATFYIIGIENTEDHAPYSERAKAVYVLGIASALQVLLQYAIARNLTNGLGKRSRMVLITLSVVASIITTVAIATSDFGFGDLFS